MTSRTPQQVGAANRRMSLKIDVAGRPTPQGNHARGRYGGIYETSAGHGAWREAVRAETQRATGESWVPLAEPVAVVIRFFLLRPKSAPKRVSRPSGKKCDLDKLVRATLDGLVDGHALADDGLVVELYACKWFGAPGCEIEIETLDGTEIEL